MLVEVKVPPLAESVPDATVLTWHHQTGEAVTEGDNLVDLETDKVTLEVPAPASGTLAEVRAAEGTTVEAGDVLAVIDTEAAGASAPASGTGPAASEATPPAAVAAQASEPATSAAPASAPKLSPAVRKLLDEHGIDASDVPGTGKDGRVTKADVLAYLERQAEAPAPEPAMATVTPLAPPSGHRPEERVPMTRLRRRAAERLLAAQQENAILTTFNEVDMSAVMALRKRHRDAFEQRHGVRLGFMSFFTRAAVEALRRFPIVNASVDGDDIIYHGYYDIGIAVSSPRGLVVPIVRDADQLSFAEIEQTINDYGQRARDGNLRIEELTGGTFTITNGGVFGSLLSTPIINPPQSAILGMHKIQDRPVAIDGEVAIRPMMYLALSYDHRIIDGRDAVQFLVAIKEAIEDPSRLLLEV